MLYILLEVCMLQEAYEPYKVKAKTSVCRQTLGSHSKKAHLLPQFNEHQALCYLPVGQVVLWGREDPGGRGEQ